MDSGDGNGSSKGAGAEAEAEPILDGDALQPLTLTGDFEHEEQSRRDSDATTAGLTPNGTENSKSFPSVESTTSESCSTPSDFLQLNPSSENIDPKSSPTSEGTAKEHTRDTQSDAPIATLHGSSGSISQATDVTRELPVPILSQTESPPIQIMERSGSYDSNQFLASVFRSRSSTPRKWSANSNDSLFSIQLGHSLATEQFGTAGADSRKLEEFKSGELGKPKEVHSSGVVKFSDQVTVLGQTSKL